MCLYKMDRNGKMLPRCYFASSSLYLASCGSLKSNAEPRHVCTEMVKTSLLSSCCKLQVPLKVPCNAEFVFAIVACILKLILGSHRLEIKMCSSFFMLVFIVYTLFNGHFLSFIAHILLLCVCYFHVYSCFIICICSWISCVLQH